MNAASSLLASLSAQLLVRGWLSANNVIFPGPGGGAATVVDTGYATHVPQTLALLKQALGSAGVARVVNTHLHSDHCGGNRAIQEACGAHDTLVPIGYRDAVQPWDEDRLSYRLTGQQCSPFGVTGFLHPGTTLELGNSEWEIHPAPGHDPLAVMFFEPRSGVLISGDALWERRLAIIFPELTGESGGFDSAARTLDEIEKLRPTCVLPGHGEAFVAVDDAIAQSRKRLEAFARSPARHRDHARRALIMFHMLERREQTWADLADWVLSTPIMKITAVSDKPGDEVEQAIGSLVADGILVLDRLDRTLRVPEPD